MALTGSLVAVADLSQSSRREMFALMERHYEGVSISCFEADLEEKQWVIQLVDPYGHLCGFSTQMVLKVTIQNQPVKALFSGDTIVAREYWGDHTLMRLGGTLALSLSEGDTGSAWYWFLISQGYKTYRFLPVFFRDFYPRYDAFRQPELRTVTHVLAEQKFGDRFDPQRGIIRTVESQYCLRSGLAEITEDRMRDPHIRFFASCNPGHVIGDELCCIARLSRENLTQAALRILG